MSRSRAIRSGVIAIARQPLIMLAELAWRWTLATSILVLGDSFMRIYEKDEPGSAGFIAHLARALKTPLTSIVNDGGASTLVRQELARRADLLTGKKLVIWEFVERDIRFGTEGWKDVPLPGPAAGRGTI